MATRSSHVSLALVGGQEDRRAASDADLARAMMAGSTWAVAEAWRRYAPMVLTLARRALGSQAEAEDVGQEVFCRLFRKVKSLRDPESLRSFIYAFALRALKSELRRRKLRSWLIMVKPEVLVGLGSRTVDFESRDILRKFSGLLDRLPPRARLVFVLRRMEAMTVEEVAASMELSESTVKRSMAAAASRLSRWIAADPDLAGLVRGEWE
ncbi:MAG: sigma-70 family RNA polymerase sigma factor [Polyangia bacterium]|jgi:RNA polymerase sigma-70 factor (ECF subfamily)